MQAILTQIIAQLNSSVFVLLCILGFAGFALYKIGGIKQTFSQHDRRLDKLDDMHDKIVELTTKVQMIYEHTLPNKLVSFHSPLDLTPLGKEFARIVGAENIFNKYLEPLKNQVNKACPAGTTAYDIQIAVLEIVKNNLPRLLSPEEISIIKDTAFSKGVLIEDVWPIFGIFLRNYILRERGISILALDKHPEGI